MAEGALLYFVSDRPHQGVRPKRAILAGAGGAGREIRSDDVGHEAAIDFPPEHCAHDGISTQIGQHGKTHFGVRAEVTRLAFDPARTNTKAYHSHDGTPARRMSTQRIERLGGE